MARSRLRLKGRRESGSFLALPHTLLDSPQWASLSVFTRILILDIAAQYRGTNNGDLSAAWSIMQKRGWKSRDTLGRALKEALDRGFIELTRQGGRNRPNLYALTWLRIDECGGKLEVPSTRVASGLWKNRSSDTAEAPN